MMGSKEESRKQIVCADSPGGDNEDGRAYEANSCLDAAESRQDGLSLECAFCVYYEILRSLKPQDRLMFFKIISLVDQMIIFSELFDEEH